jgi:acylglycerol lipase
MQRLFITRTASFILIVWTLGACSPQLVLPGPQITEPKLTATTVVMADGVKLPLHQWQPKQAPKAILLALHGFNDYGQFVKEGARFFADHGLHVYAYDQRGFGAAAHFGQWPGRKSLADDLITTTNLLRQKHPGVPLYHLGASMGGAVIMTAAIRPSALKTDGLILAAPAVWGRASMHFYERWLLNILSHTVPWLTLTGKGLDIKPSDNIGILRALGRDPKIIKETRVDTIWGLVNLMDDALSSASKLGAKALILYGDRDDVIKPIPTEMMLKNLPRTAKNRQKIIRYPDGYHMLLRDLQAKKVWQDILTWIYDD